MPLDSSAPPAPQTPGASPALSETAAEDLVHGICFKTGPPRTLGAELEWLVLDAERPGEILPPDRLTAAHDAARALTLQSRLSIEPGGQLELSSAPAPPSPAAWTAYKPISPPYGPPCGPEVWSCAGPAAMRAGRCADCCTARATTRWRSTSTAPAPPGAR